MKPSRLLPALLFSTLLASPALAGDAAYPPELRPSTFDITVGVFGSGAAVKSSYSGADATDLETELFKGNLDGTAYGMGLKAGVDYRSNGWLVGVAGDWTFSGKVGDDTFNDGSTALDSTLNMNNLGTLRARAGLEVGDATVYVTGGLAQAQVEYTAEFETAKGSDKGWSKGWTVGAGVDYALTESLSLGLEYLYVKLDDQTFKVTDSDTDTEYQVREQLDGIHTVRMGLNYAFSL